MLGRLAVPGGGACGPPALECEGERKRRSPGEPNTRKSSGAARVLTERVVVGLKDAGDTVGVIRTEYSPARRWWSDELAEGWAAVSDAGVAERVEGRVLDKDSERGHEEPESQGCRPEADNH